MSSNFRLPTAGEANWGAALNAYLENLNFRLGTLETKTSTAEGSASIQNIGTASSGLTGECTASMKDSIVTLVLKKGASIFISGDINTSFNSENDDDITITSESIDSDTAPVFVYLHYDETKTPPFEIKTTTTFDLTYLDVLIGFAWNDEFISYYGSSLKTISQHHYEIEHRWVDTNSTTSGFNFNLTAKSDEFGFAPTGSVLMYCGNTGASDTEKNYFSPIAPYTVSVKSKLFFFQDKKDNNGILTSTPSDLENWNQTETTERGRRFRILLTAFGYCIIQEAAIDSDNYSTLTSGDQLHNTKFNNNLGYYDSDDVFVGYDASLWVELYRFGFTEKGSIEIDAIDKTFINTGGFIVQTLNQDVVWQQGKKSWLMDSSTINLNNTVFTTGSDVYNKAMKLAYSYPVHQEKQYFKLDGSVPQNFGGDAKSPLLILTNSTKLPNEYFLDITLDNADLSACSGLYVDKDKVSLGLFDDRVIENSIQTAGLSITKQSDAVKLYSSNSFVELSPTKVTVAANTSVTPTENSITLAAYSNVLLSGKAIDLTSDGLLSMSSRSNISLDCRDGAVTINGETTITGVTNLNGNLKIDEDYSIYFTSDRRRKEKFSTIDTSYLDVVKATPVLNYYYKNSDKQQVGIIAQDLENALSTNIDVFVNKQDTVELKNQRSLSETKLVYILWKALQEEMELRNKLEQRVAKLEQNF